MAATRGERRRLIAVDRQGPRLLFTSACPAADKNAVDDLCDDFLTEARELLAHVEVCLASPIPLRGERLAEVFRAVHTIKGGAGFMGFAKLERIAHAGEHLLERMRNGEIRATRTVIDALLRLLDALRAWLAIIESSGTKGDAGDEVDAPLLRELAWLSEQTMDVPPSVATQATGVAEADHQADHEAMADALRDVLKAGDIAAETTLRLDVGVVDRMMQQVGELVLVRNQMSAAMGEDARYLDIKERLNTVTAQLRETVTETRLQPVGQLFARFPRVVRSLAQICGRELRLECQGEETGLDRSLMDALKEPLLHAIRNAVDHGIESAEQRVAAGKPRAGCLLLSATREGGYVVLELADDGAGVDLDLVRRRATERGLVTADVASAMSEAEVLELLFQAGFSTREEVSLISGRGVGMDVVRAGLTRVGGSVEMRSVRGKGTSLRMRVPLTLAIVQALVVRTGANQFVLPLGAVEELLWLPQTQGTNLLPSATAARLLPWRGELLPLLPLADVLQGETCERRPGYIAVLASRGLRFALAVDDLGEPEEIVIRPMPPMLLTLPLYAGVCVLGSGEACTVLDVDALEALTGRQAVVTCMTPRPASAASAPQATVARGVLYNDLAGRPAVLPVGEVLRLCEACGESMSCVAGRWLVTLEEGVLPLLDVDATWLPPATQTLLLLAGENGMARGALPVGGVLDLVDLDGNIRYEDEHGSALRVSDRLVEVRAGDRLLTMPEVAHVPRLAA